MKIALSRELPLDAKKLLSIFYSEIRMKEESRPLSASELAKLAEGCDVLICVLTDKIDKGFLNAVPRLKHLITFSTGIDHIDLSALKEKNIRLSHTPAVLTDATADLSFALLLSCARNLRGAAQHLSSGKFNGFGPKAFLGLELKGSTLGILGMGKIGRAVSERASAFGMRVIQHSRSEKDIKGVTAVSLEVLLNQSDVLSLHCNLDKENFHLINAQTLRKMKPNAILINTARGKLIDETELIEHLKTYPEFQVGLDVFEDEPIVSKELLELPNAFCLPHIGSATWTARRRMAQTCVDEAIRFAKGETLQNLAF